MPEGEPLTRDDLTQALKASEDRLVTLLTEFKESLERELHGIRDRLDAQTIRLERQGALIQTGSRWTTRITDWSEKVDSLLDQQAKDIADLRRRISDLENRR
jgi:gas vesicle protein